MSSIQILVAFTLVALASTIVTAYDPSPLQDICVAINDTKNGVFVNGKFCKDPMKAKPEDFFFSGLNIPRNTNNNVGSTATRLTVDVIPGLNTLGMAIARVDYAPNGGLNPPHHHPRASEIFTVLEGILYAGFVTSNPIRLFAKVLYPGDVYVFPLGHIHFQLNIANTSAVAIVAFNSQNPGFHFTAPILFGSNPPINSDVLTKAFELDKKTVAYLQKFFTAINS